MPKEHIYRDAQDASIAWQIGTAFLMVVMVVSHEKLAYVGKKLIVKIIVVANANLLNLK